MTALNHDRPVFKLIDALRRERSMTAKIGEAGVSKLPVGRAIGAVKRAADLSQDRVLVHQCALKVLDHVARHGNIRVIGHFLDVVADNKSKIALVDWFTANGPVSFDAMGEVRFEKGKPTKLGEAALSPYWKFNPKPSKKPFDPIAELDKVLRAIKKNEAQRNSADASSRLIITDLEALIRRHG